MTDNRPHGRRLRCHRIFSGGRWLADQCLELRPDGRIGALYSYQAQTVDQTITDPLLPAMPNLHSHAFQYGLAGLTGAVSGKHSDSFWTWRERMYHLVRQLTPDSLQAISAYCFMQMLKAGYGRVAEFHYIHHTAAGQVYRNPAETSLGISRAAAQTGIGLTLLPVLYCRSDFGADTVLEHQRAFRHTPDSYLELISNLQRELGALPNQYLGIAPHSLRAVNAADLTAVLQSLPNELVARPIHIHIAEQRKEVQACEAYHGVTPLRWLMTQFDVNTRWCLVHATQADREEQRLAAAGGAVIGLCPSTEADLGDGIFAAEHWQALNGRWGIGSDSNLRLDVAEELRLLEYTQRLVSGRRNVLSAGQPHLGAALYREACLGGRQALGQACGDIVQGDYADFICLDGNHPQLAGKADEALLDTYLFAGGPGMIKQVWIAGEPVVEHGEHRDESAIRRQFVKTMRTLNDNL